jgi:antirestriction protein
VNEQFRGEHGNEAQAHEQDPSVETKAELTRPNIYVASLADYNAGCLHGEWLDATLPTDELYERIRLMLKRSPLAKAGESVEEWAIHDYENFGAIRLGEYSDLDRVGEHARAIVAHGLAYAGWYDGNREGTVEQFVDAYQGEFDSALAYAESLGDECGWETTLEEVVPTSLRPYVSVNYHLLANDLQLGSEIYTVATGTGSVWVFLGQ